MANTPWQIKCFSCPCSKECFLVKTQGSLVNTLKEVRPTSFLGVPRVWEKIEEKMKTLGLRTTGLKKIIANWAKRIGLKGNYSKLNG